MRQKNQMWTEKKMVEVKWRQMWKVKMMGGKWRHKCQHQEMSQKNQLWQEKVVEVKWRHKAMMEV